MEELLPLLIFFVVVVVVAARLSPSRPSSPAPPPPPPAAAAAAAAAAIIIISLFLFLPFACPVVTPPLAAATASLAAATVTPSYLHRERAAEVSPREDLRQGVQKGREASHFTCVKGGRCPFVSSLGRDSRRGLIWLVGNGKAGRGSSGVAMIRTEREPGLLPPPLPGPALNSSPANFNRMLMTVATRPLRVVEVDFGDQFGGFMATSATDGASRENKAAWGNSENSSHLSRSAGIAAGG